MDFRPGDHSGFDRSKDRVDRLTHGQKKAAEAARWQGQIHTDYLNEQLGQAAPKHPKKMGTKGVARLDESKQPPYQQKGWKGVADDNYDDRT